MTKRQSITLLIFSICLLGTVEAASSKTFFTFDLKKDVGSTTWIYTQKSFEQAEKINADAIILNMNTYGGEVMYADSIRTKILNSEIPVYVFVDNNAASAGALISIACDKIYMRKGASIGAATVVNETGEQMPDKYQSYMRATMRATAEAHGKDTITNGTDTTYVWKRDPLIAEAMVDERTVVEGISEAGKTLTFTTEEALKYGYCDGIAESIQEIAQKEAGESDFEIVVFEPTTWDNIKGFFMSSVIQGLLIMFIIGGIYFELQTPGVGFPLGVAITAAVLYFLPLYIDGLAANWEILLFLTGLVLVAVEIFAFPGFGVLGILGIVLVITGLTLSMVGNIAFDFEPVETGSIRKAILTVTMGIGLGFAVVLYLSTKIGQRGLFRRVSLETSLNNAEGYIGVPIVGDGVIGKSGIASTDLRPSGKVKIEQTTHDAVSEEGFIEKGTPIAVIRYETGQVYVVKCG